MPGLFVFLIGLGLVAVAGADYVVSDEVHLYAMAGGGVGAFVAFIGLVQMVFWSLSGGGESKARRPGTATVKSSPAEIELMIQSMLFIAWSDNAMHGLEVQHICNVLKNQFGVNVTLPVVQAVSRKFSKKQADGFPAVLEYQRSKIAPPTRDRIISMAIGVAGSDRKMYTSERDAIYVLVDKLAPPNMTRARVDQELSRFVIEQQPAAPAAPAGSPPAATPAPDGKPAEKPAPMNELDIMVQAMLYVARADGTMHGLEIDHICRVMKASFDVPVTMALVQQVSNDFTAKQSTDFPAVLEAQRDNITPAMRDKIIEVAIGVASADRRLLFAEGEAINMLAEKLQPPTYNRARIATELDRLLR
jgi:uncharacterized tellurite resistance protein B-like protein